MGNRKDYYKILGVDKDASQKDIKNAFRELSKRYHPDKNPGDKNAEAMFKDVAEAYDVLGNEEKRKEYDNPHSTFDFASNGMDFGNMSMDDILAHFQDLGFHDFGPRMKREQVRGGSLRITFDLSLEEMYNGVTKKVKYKRYVPCDECGGSGLTKDSKKRTCRTCGGSGMVFGSNGFVQHMSTCPTCGGQGSYIENPCKKCGGHGIVASDYETEIQIPKGIRNGTLLTLRGLGHCPPHGKGEYGDLQVLIRQQEHPLYERQDDDLYVYVDVPVTEAIVGCDKEVKTIDGGTISIKVPRCCEDEKLLRVGGKGMPRQSGYGYGNLYCIIKHNMPKDASDDAIKTISELNEKGSFTY